MLGTLYYAPKPFWAPPLWTIGPQCPLCVHPLWDLATQCVTSGIILRGRGNLPVLVLLGEVICTTSRCLHVLWESCRPLEWFWCYWGWSAWWRAPICCEHIVQLLLNVPAGFQGDRSRQRRCIVVRIWGWVRGEVGAHTSPLWWSSGPLLHCVRIPALSRSWVHICACGTSTFERVVKPGVTGVDPITIRQLLSSELVTAAL